MAALHARCFTNPRPWRAAEFAEILSQPSTFLCLRPDGLLIGRVVLDEAELLTLAVDPDRRRQGIARALLADFTAAATSRGAATAFLEVAADNIPALALYRGVDWADAGRRRRYYGPATDAVILRLVLGTAQKSG